MRLPLSWLREFTPYEGSAEELADRLTMAGLEVEGVDRPARDYRGVVVGQVIERSDHPDADRLSLCRVTVGSEPLTIVCGAPNVAAGQKVPVATVGSVLPGGMEVGEAEIRGQLSRGMICSEKELEIGEDAEGIMVLDPDARVGCPFAEHLGLDDVIIEVDVLPNRPDALSVYGLARETAALFDLPLEPLGGGVEEEGDPAGREIAVEVEDPLGCPLFTARLIRGVEVGSSPPWMAGRLRAAGMRPINSAVDITNYIMLETGQPQHAFDLARIPGGRIVVRRARPGERLITLDGVERRLAPEYLMITSGEEPLAVAGVMGGRDSEIGEKTGDVLLETAHFDPMRIGLAGGRLNIVSEARKRFERGVDPALPPVAADRAARLFASICGGRVAPGIVKDGAEDPAAPLTVTVDRERLDTLLGRSIPAEDAVALLERTGFEVPGETGADEWRVRVPTWRPDVEDWPHIGEEVARLYGYNALGSSTALSGEAPDPPTPRQRLREALRDALVHQGLHEVLTSSLVGVEHPHPLTPGREPVVLANPQSEGQSHMRRDLLPGLLRVVRHNLRRQHDHVRIFELGPVYHVLEGEAVQEEWVAGALTGRRWPEPWVSGNGPLTWEDIYGIIQAVLGGLGISEVRSEARDHEGLEAGMAAVLAGPDGSLLGRAGRVSDGLLEAMDLEEEVWAFVLPLEGLGAARTGLERYRGLPRHPAADRDLAVTVPADVPVGGILEEVREGASVERALLLDTYRGEQVEEGRKSVAISIRYRDPDRTLTDKEIERLHNEVLKVLTRSFDARLRE
ncbi:MAG: phenylalanine--tRNA ligase subunit beta [bacterium]